MTSESCSSIACRMTSSVAQLQPEGDASETDAGLRVAEGLVRT
jgi:hypothetical protein